MAPFLLPLIMGGAQSVVGAIGSMLNKRPDYSIPAAATQKLALAQMAASNNMSGYNQASSNIGLSAANTIAAAKESGNPMSILPQIQANQNQAYRDLSVQNEQYKQQSQQNLQGALGDYANLQDQAFQLNEYQPYVDRKKAFSDLVGAGLKNISGGADSMMMQQFLNKGQGGNAGQVTQQLTRNPIAPLSVPNNRPSISSVFNLTNPFGGVPLNPATSQFTMFK